MLLPVARIVALLCCCAAAGNAQLDSETTSGRQIGWWFDCPKTEDDPGVAGALEWVTAHKSIVSTIMMRCGVFTCDTNHSAPRGGTNSCLNNGGVGGTITGELLPSGKKLLPEFVKLGVKVELWLGEDDSRQSALHMFKDPAAFAADLIRVSRENPGLTGYNLDTETRGSTAADARLSVPFLKYVTNTLAAAPGGPIRFSTDVACSGAGKGWCPMISDCKLLANSGVAKIMNMDTYWGTDFEDWYDRALRPALADGIPRNKIGAGLGLYNCTTSSGCTSEPHPPWNLTPQSAKDRICALMNHSFTELDMFILSQSSSDPYKNYPYDFWIPELERFMAGGGCPLPKISSGPRDPSCPAAGPGMPADAWQPGGDPGCCVSSEKRDGEPPKTCDVDCAKKECTTAGGSWYWKPFNYTVHPFECCNKTTPSA